MKARRVSPAAVARAMPAGLGLVEAVPWAGGIPASPRTALWLRLALLLAFLVTFLAACGSSGLEVTRAQYGDAWPFSVEQGTLTCETSVGGRLRSAVFKSDEKEYALNVVAEGRGYDSVVPIWRNNPQFLGAKVDLAPMVALALQQC